jgi:hypothetical protein
MRDQNLTTDYLDKRSQRHLIFIPDRAARCLSADEKGLNGAAVGRVGVFIVRKSRLLIVGVV